jgi:uncharacterized protein
VAHSCVNKSNLSYGDNILPKLNIAVVGSGISGLSCAWALSQRHHVTVIEADDRLGGHANTQSVMTSAGPVAVDTGFIVCNTWTYPNFTALMDYLDQPLIPTQMSFSVSADNGKYEYSATNLGTLFGTPKQWLSPGHWKMMADLIRFYKTAETHAPHVAQGTSLGDYLKSYRYGTAFSERHILPMAGAIWSATPQQIANYPFHAFLAFFKNHKLFELGKRPDWHVVAGGSTRYVEKLIEDSRFEVMTRSAVSALTRKTDGVELHLRSGRTKSFDHVVLATHADTALQILQQPTSDETELLSPFKTSANQVYLHRDAALMPKQKRFWSAWNYRLSPQEKASAEVTYWMNALQKLTSPEQHFVSLNPSVAPAATLVDGFYNYRHPIFNAGTLEAQKQLWNLQGVDRVWFCGAWFGAGFHEDGLQAGLAVAEQLGGVRRPWNVADESARIHVGLAHPKFTPTVTEAAE